FSLTSYLIFSLFFCSKQTIKLSFFSTGQSFLTVKKHEYDDKEDVGFRRPGSEFFQNPVRRFFFWLLLLFQEEHGKKVKISM
ncbi:unnamed protein product, partial [Brassica oleracea]